MTSQKKLLFTGLCLAVAAIAFLLAQPAAETPECLQAQEEMKQAVLNDNGFASFVGEVSDIALDRAIVQRGRKLDAGGCGNLARGLGAQREALAHTPWAPRMAAAATAVRHALHECHDRRIAGELKTHAESAQCSNPAITDIYTRVGYPYADLVARFTAKRLALARALDSNNPGGTEDLSEFARLALDISDEERRRVTQAR